MGGGGICVYGMAGNKTYVLRTSGDVTPRGNGCTASAACEVASRSVSRPIRAWSAEPPGIALYLMTGELQCSYDR